jgi:hypothetical protein
LALFLGIRVASVGFEKLISSGGLAALPSAAAQITAFSAVCLTFALTAIDSYLQSCLAPKLALVACLFALAFFAALVVSVWFAVILLAFAVSHL